MRHECTDCAKKFSAFFCRKDSTHLFPAKAHAHGMYAVHGVSVADCVSRQPCSTIGRKHGQALGPVRPLFVHLLCNQQRTSVYGCIVTDCVSCQRCLTSGRKHGRGTGLFGILTLMRPVSKVRGTVSSASRDRLSSKEWTGNSPTLITWVIFCGTKSCTRL